MKHPDRQQGSVNQHEGGVCWERWECLFKMRGQLSELFSLINVILGHFTFHFNWSVIGEILGTSTSEWHRNRLEKPECLWGQFPLSLSGSGAHTGSRMAVRAAQNWSTRALNPYLIKLKDCKL